MKNSNNNHSSTNYRSPAHVPTLSAPDLWDRLYSQHARLAGDAAFVARLRAEGALKEQDPGPLLLEYLRFAYLAWTMPDGATPSKVVDEAWHTHILFTRSYERFCRETRGTMLHHDPGGGDEGDAGRFQEAYRRTLERYEDEFGPAPPGYWPRPAVPKPEPPPEIPEPASKTLLYPGPRRTYPRYEFLLFSPAFAFVVLMVTSSGKAALQGALIGAVLGFAVALIERRPAGASQGSGPREPLPVRRPPPPRQTRAPQPARSAKPSGRRDGSTTSSSSTTADTPYVPFIDAGPSPGGSHHGSHGGHHSHSDGGSHGGGHGDGGGSGGGDGGGGGSSCSSGSSCGGGGCGGG